MRSVLLFVSVVAAFPCFSDGALAANRCGGRLSGLANTSKAESNVSWKDTRNWNQSIRHSNDFFIRAGWDETSGSFASEISSDGKVISDTRHLISTSRMIYGLAIGSSVEPTYLPDARCQADFLLGKMTASDLKGPYFEAAVDANGTPKGARTSLVVNEQAYGLNGLVALYTVTHDPALRAKIEVLYKSFYDQRFTIPFPSVSLIPMICDW